MGSQVEPERRIRVDGHAARRRILDATAELAGERGVDGASIGAISERSGLPKSSIYWHFGDKEALIASVVDDSYQRWIAHIRATTEPRDHERLGAGFGPSISAITNSPDFLRLGLMLSLDQRQPESPARQRFIEIRAEVRSTLRRLYRRTFPDLSEAGLDGLAQLTMALTDGFFIAERASETELAANHHLIEAAINGAAQSLV